MQTWSLPLLFFFFFLKGCTFFKVIYLFIYFWLRWVFIAARGLSAVAVSGGYSSLLCTGFSLRWPLLLRSTGSRCTGSVVVVHGLSCSAACGIFPAQGSNPCPCIGRQILNHCTTREVPTPLNVLAAAISPKVKVYLHFGTSFLTSLHYIKFLCYT